MSVQTRRPAGRSGARGSDGRRPTGGRGARGGRGSSATRRRRTRAGRAALRRRRLLLALGAGVVMLAALIAVVVGASGSSSGLVCVDAEGRPVEEGATIAGYGAEQLVNARAIIDAGSAVGAPRDAQIIAVMTAMGESGLRVLDHGDDAGPDSRGLFQQRDNGAWGSYDDRMNPTISADSFYRELLETPGWESMEPTLAAHEVQGNSDARHYERWYQPAVEVVDALTIRSLECGGDGVIPAPSRAAD